MTAGEQNLLADLNEFVRQTSDLLEDEPQTTGIRPNPVIEVTEQTLDTARFGFNFGPLPETEVLPTGGGPPVLEGACCVPASVGCFVTTESDCVTNFGGTYLGNGTTCTPDPCTGKCCVCEGVMTRGTCSEISWEDCMSDDGTYFGNETTCDDPCDCCPPSTFVVLSLAGNCTDCGDPCSGSGCTGFDFISGSIFADGSCGFSTHIDYDTCAACACGTCGGASYIDFTVTLTDTTFSISASWSVGTDTCPVAGSATISGTRGVPASSGTVCSSGDMVLQGYAL